MERRLASVIRLSPLISSSRFDLIYQFEPRHSESIQGIALAFGMIALGRGNLLRQRLFILMAILGDEGSDSELTQPLATMGTIR